MTNDALFTAAGWFWVGFLATATLLAQWQEQVPFKRMVSLFLNGALMAWIVWALVRA